MITELINNGVASVFDVVALSQIGYEFVIADGKVLESKKVSNG